MEQPLLRLGLLGFSEPAGLRLQGWAIQIREGWPTWRTSDPHLADAWMINGSAVEVLGRDGVVIHHPHDSNDRLTLNRSEVDRPLAFAQPLPEGFASAEYFDADDETSVRQRLQRFEAWLRPLRSQFALGAEVLKRFGHFEGIVHVAHEGRLLAVVDFERWQAGLLVPARPVDIAMADWTSAAEKTVDIPPSFMRLPLHRVLWIYTVRSQRDLLPERYRDRPIYLRRVPQVPARWFSEGHLSIMRELLAQPAELGDLQVRTGLMPAELCHHLSVLYHSGGLTTDGDRARRAEAATRRTMNMLQWDQNLLDSSVRERLDPFDEIPPTSILRESRHSPLRVTTGQGLASSSDEVLAGPPA